MAQVKKHQAHVQYQEQVLEKLAKEPRDKQVEIDQLQYELGATTRRNQAEIASLRQRISDLELQLLEARKEADEYYKGNLERNMEVTALGQEISGLKLDLAQKRPPINFGAQELLIQQLQDEIRGLRQQGSDVSAGADLNGGQGVTTNATIQTLQHKLKNAARKIAELAKERQQLIEMGNKLRAELQRAGIDIPKIGPKRSARPVPPPISEENLDHMMPAKPLSQQFMNKLSQLEKLQYELTKQELQYAQRYQEPQGGAESSYSEPEEQRPPSILKNRVRLRESEDTNLDVRASVNTEGGDTAVSIPTQRSQLMMSMSSVGGESLQEIWKMLDEARPSPTPRLASPGRPQRSGRGQGASNINISQDSAVQDSGELQLSGHQTGSTRPRQEKKLSDKAAGKVQKNIPQKPKVRNYNYRDDNSFR